MREEMIVSSRWK